IIISGRVCCHSAAEWGGYGEGRPDYSAARVLADAEDQLEILGTEKFDVLFLHDPPEIEPTLEAGGALEGLEQVRQQGAVDFIGYGMRPHDFHLAHIASGRTDAMLCFSDYNLLRQSATDAILPAAAAADLGVLNGWSIMRGWLTGVPVERFIPRDKWGEDQHRAEAMRLWCGEQGLDMLKLTLQFCLREERIHGNPIGSLNIEQLERNVAAAMATVADETIAAFEAAAL
ncbi:MAG: aldo/keto reductase, partial [Gemmatimonadetes bacterium]|nr:aldo/keto reductase [Gemmatimonadota bacterium]